MSKDILKQYGLNSPDKPEEENILKQYGLTSEKKKKPGLLQQVGQKIQSLDKGGELAVHSVIGGVSKVAELPRDLLYDKVGDTGKKVLDAIYGRPEQLTSNIARKNQEQIRTDYLKKPGIDKVDKFMMQTGETLVPIATSIATGPAAPYTFATITGGNYAKEAELEGANPLQQAAYGSIMGGIESVTEKIPFEKVMKAIGGKTGVKALLSTMGAEGLQEAVTNPLNVIAKRLIYGGGKDEKIIDLGRELESFAMGATTGGILHGGATVANKAANVIQERTNQPKLAKTIQAANNTPEQTQPAIIDANIQEQNEPLPAPNKPIEAQSVNNDIMDYANGKKELPETEAELQGILDTINNMEPKLKLNLQFFAEKVRKLIDSKFRTNTLQRSVDLTDADRDQLLLEDFGYGEQSSKEWQSKAEKTVADNQQQIEEQIKNQKALVGGQQAHEAAIIAKNYLANARETGDYSNFRNWLQVVAEKTRETARALKGTDTAWEKTKSAESAVLNAQRKVQWSDDYLKKHRKDINDKINKEAKAKFDSLKQLDSSLTYDQVRDMVKKKYGFPVLTDEDVKTIVETIDKAKQFPDGSREQEVLIAKVKQLIANKKVATPADKIKGLFRISLLSNFKTNVRNVFGNAVFGITENIKDIPAAGIDAITSKFTGKRVYDYNPMANIASEAKGFGKGLADQIDDVKRGVDTSPTRGQMELPSGRTFKNPVLNAIDEAVKTALKFGDRPFYEAVYNRRLNELKRIYKTQGITEEMELESKLYALERTFQGDSELGDWFANMKRSISSPSIRLVVEAAIPFTQTPSNIFDRLLEYSPGGLVKAVIMPFKARKTGEFNQRQFVDSMARSFTGTGLMMLGYLLARAGVIAGGGDRDKEKEFNRLTGKQPYTFKVGNVRFSFDWASPVGSMFAVGANAFKAGETKEDLLSKIDKTAQGGVDTFFSQSVMSGLQELFGGYSAYETLKNAAFSPMTLLNPTILRQTTQAIDPYERETMASNRVSQNLNRIISNTPGLSQTLPRKVDTLGNEVKRDNNLLNVFLNPARVSKESNNPIVNEIQSVYEQTKDKDVLPRKAPVKLNDRTLRPQEYTRLQKLVGEKTTEMIEMIMNEPDYQEATPEQKAMVLSTIIKRAYETAKNEFSNQLNGFGDDM